MKDEEERLFKVGPLSRHDPELLISHRVDTV